MKVRRRDPRRPGADLRQTARSRSAGQGDTVTCQGSSRSPATRGNKSIQYLKNKSKIMMKFAPLGQTGIYAPIQATVGTKVGTLTIRARKFETTK